MYKFLIGAVLLALVGCVPAHYHEYRPPVQRVVYVDYYPYYWYYGPNYWYSPHRIIVQQPVPRKYTVKQNERQTVRNKPEIRQRPVNPVQRRPAPKVKRNDKQKIRNRR
jgi:hypothetical protein